MTARPIGWERLEAEWWATIRETIAKPWPREAVLMDLRYWQGQVAISGGKVERPGRPALVAFWGWPDWKARQAMKAEGEWGDPRRIQPASSAPPTGIQPPSNGHPADSTENADNTEVSSNPHPVVIQPASSGHPAGLPARGSLHESRSTSHDHGSPENIHVPPEPARPLDPEPPCAPQQQIQAYATESTAKEATNTQPALFGAATVGTVESPKLSKKAAAIQQVWEAYKVFMSRPGKQPGEGDSKLIAKFLAKYEADELVSVIRWAWQCDESRGNHLWLQGRAGGEGTKYLGLSNLLTEKPFDDRLRYAKDWEANPARRIRTVEEILGKVEKGPGPTPEPVAPPEDPAAIWEEIIRRRSTGIRVCPDDIPNRTKDAIRAAGGWHQLGLLNEFTERQAKTTFIAAYRNQSVNGHQRTA